MNVSSNNFVGQEKHFKTRKTLFSGAVTRTAFHYVLKGFMCKIAWYFLMKVKKSEIMNKKLVE